MMKESGTSLFDILRHRAARAPASIATRSSERVLTYRRLWSRIERGTARLISEWGAASGDTIAYWGQGHQDALSLYFAAARCGIRLLPLEHASLRENATALLRQHRVAVLLHDDDIAVETLPAASFVPRIARLSSLVATRCHHYPPVDEKASVPSLILPADVQTPRSLLQLTEGITDVAATHTFRVTAALFDDDVFAPCVLPVLAAGGTILFR
ncbi:AMP-binding protein [Oxalicibacterium solurbis]|uniref:AMP-binding protein n=1 Tax=Oxalicibacterium solurbis TaxID=69280 RepID=UPI001E5A5566|nr:AMP-binding protein [Oxalicibacterium solurbis]